MNSTRKLSGFWTRTMVAGIFIMTLFPIGWVHGATLDDTVNPTVSITSPAAGGATYSTNQSTVTIEGIASDDNAIKEIVWENDQGGAGFTDASTNWLGGEWNWKADSIPLVVGTNTITVTAQDAVGNTGSDFLVVNRTATPTTTLPDDVRGIELDRTKVKLNIFADTPGDDHVSIVSYLKINAGEDFVKSLMDLDVTAILKLRDPDAPNSLIEIFRETIGAFTIDSKIYSKYRYTSGPSGIRELTIAKNTSKNHYMYLYIEDVDFLPQIREHFRSIATGSGNPNDKNDFPNNYAAWLAGVNSLILTLQGGDLIAWEGEISFIGDNAEKELFTGADGVPAREQYLFNR